MEHLASGASVGTALPALTLMDCVPRQLGTAEQCRHLPKRNLVLEQTRRQVHPVVREPVHSVSHTQQLLETAEQVHYL